MTSSVLQMNTMYPGETEIWQQVVLIIIYIVIFFWPPIFNNTDTARCQIADDMDANKDGKISKEEFAKQHGAKVEKCPLVVLSNEYTKIDETRIVTGYEHPETGEGDLLPAPGDYENEDAVAKTTVSS